MAELRQVLPGDPSAEWQPWGTYTDILVDRCNEGIARVAINRPSKRNAFRPQTVAELCDAFSRIRDDREIGVVLFTGVARPLMVVSPSAPAAVRACVATAAMSVMTASHASTCWICGGSFAAFPRL